jgi:hypothetical protein
MITKIETFTVCNCCNCGVDFAMTDAFIQNRKNDRKSWYCPNGHSQWFPGETASDKAQRLAGQLDMERTRRQQAEMDVDYARRARKAVSTRLRKVKVRVGHGVCPCCTRTFKQLAAHMAAKHPAYAASSDGETHVQPPSP